MRALVVSGGGSHGAYAGGVVEHLVKDLGVEYDILLGTSTGALLTPLVSIKEIDLIKRAYLSVGQEDIFTSTPFKVDGNKRLGLRYFNLIWHTIIGSLSFGDSSALEDTIKEFLTKNKYTQIKNSGKIVGCCVSNITYKQKEYKFVEDCDRDQYIRWMHASSSVPPFMSVIENEGSYYVDGGITEKTPIQKAIDLGATTIDAIVLDQEDPVRSKSNIKNVFNVIQQIISMMLAEIGRNDIEVAKFQAHGQDVEINLYYRPGLVGSAMVFHPESMRQNWQLGYRLANKQKFKQFKVAANTQTPIITYNGLDSNVIDS